MQKQLMQQIQQVERLASTSKLGRLLHDPARYLSVQVFQKFIYPRTHKGRLEQVSTFWGDTMEVLLPAAADIYLTGGKTHDSEIRLAKFMIARLKTGDVFMDVGAHFGYFTMLAAKLTGAEGKVYAFEAAGKTYEVLKRNTAGLPQVEALHNAVSNQEEQISFYEFPILYSEYNSIDIKQFEQEAWIQKYKPQKNEVRAVTLDLFTEALYKAPDIIKIDVEGAEDKVILGSKELLQKHSPVIVMEFLSEQRHNKAHSKAVTLLLANKYFPHAIDKDGNTYVLDDVMKYMTHLNLDSDNIVFIKNS